MGFLVEFSIVVWKALELSYVFLCLLQATPVLVVVVVVVVMVMHGHGLANISLFSNAQIKSWKILVFKKLSSQRLVLKNNEKEAFTYVEKSFTIDFYKLAFFKGC